MKHKFKMPIGDWSHDGHNQCREFAFQSNYSIAKMQKAYRESCKMVGIQFGDGCDGRSVLCEYEDSMLDEDAAIDLISFGLPVKENFQDCGYSPDELANLILHFIKLSLPDLKWKEIGMTSKMDGTKFPSLNGWWCDLNESFGYGLFY